MASELTQAALKAALHYDQETGEFTRLTGRTAGQRTGTVNGAGYVTITVGGRTRLAHRLAWMFIYGRFPEKNIDHADRNKKNNKISNLRECDQSGNMQNAGKRNGGTSKYLGVCLSSAHKNFKKKWIAQIMIGKKNIHIGLFRTEEEAHKAYMDTKKNIHLFNPC
jgi:hypothetical protein